MRYTILTILFLAGCSNPAFDSNCFKIKKENCIWSHDGASCSVVLENGQEIYGAYIKKGDYICMPEKK